MFNFLQRKIEGIHIPAIIMVSMTLGSYLFSLVRVNFLTSTFGAGEKLDIFFAAFKLPDLIFILVGSLITSFALVPFFTEKEEENNIGYYVNVLFTVYFFVLTFISLVVFIFTPFLQKLLFPGFTVEQQELVTTLTRIMLIQPILFSISYLLSSVIQVWRRFFIYALSPIFYNIGIIFGIVFLYPALGIQGVALGVVIGVFLHLLFPLMSIYYSGIKPKFILISKKDIIEVLQLVKISVPRTIALSFIFITQLVFISVASLFGEGSISIVQLSFDLHFAPITIISISYSIASFPYLSKLFLENKIKEYNDSIVSAIRYIIFLSLPMVALFILLRDNIVKVVFGVNSFDSTTLQLMTFSLSLFILSILSSGIIHIISMAFYAARETFIPFLINLVIMISTFILLFAFLLVYKTEWFEGLKNIIFDTNMKGVEIVILPFIFSLTTILGSILLVYIFSKKYEVKLFSKLFISLVQNLFATLVLFIIGSELFGITISKFNQESAFGLFMQGMLIGVLSGICWFVTLVVIKNKEMLFILKNIFKNQTFYGEKN